MQLWTGSFFLKSCDLPKPSFSFEHRVLIRQCISSALKKQNLLLSFHWPLPAARKHSAEVQSCPRVLPKFPWLPGPLPIPLSWALQWIQDVRGSPRSREGTWSSRRGSSAKGRNIFGWIRSRLSPRSHLAFFWGHTAAAEELRSTAPGRMEAGDLVRPALAQSEAKGPELVVRSPRAEREGPAGLEVHIAPHRPGLDPVLTDQPLHPELQAVRPEGHHSRHVVQLPGIAADVGEAFALQGIDRPRETLGRAQSILKDDIIRQKALCV